MCNCEAFFQWSVFFFFNLELICLITVIHILTSALAVTWRFIHSNSGCPLHISIFWGLEKHLGEWISSLPPTSLPSSSFYVSGGDRQTKSSLCRRLNNNLGQKRRVTYTPGGEDWEAGSERFFPRSCSLNLVLKWECASSLRGAGLFSGEPQRRGTGMEGQLWAKNWVPKGFILREFKEWEGQTCISGRHAGVHMEDAPAIQQGLWPPAHIWIWKSRRGGCRASSEGPHTVLGEVATLGAWNWLSCCNLVSQCDFQVVFWEGSPAFPREASGGRQGSPYRGRGGGQGNPSWHLGATCSHLGFCKVSLEKGRSERGWGSPQSICELWSFFFTWIYIISPPLLPSRISPL